VHGIGKSMIFYNFWPGNRGNIVFKKAMKTFNQMRSVRLRLCLVMFTLLMPGITDARDTFKDNNHSKKKPEMSEIQKNKEVVLKLFEQSLNERKLELLQEFVSEDYVGPGGVKGAAAFEMQVAVPINAFPDSKWDVEELIGEGNKVFVKWTLTGTHTRQFRNFAATGKTFSNTGMAIYELRNGRVINAEVHTDQLGFLQQLEILPSDLSLLQNAKTQTGQVSFIDRFTVPSTARDEFYERMEYNRNFIKKLPGFVKDAAYGRTDENGNLICVTVAIWESEEAVHKAKEAVQAEYKRIGFDPAEMLGRLNIAIDRGIYQPIENMAFDLQK
jgi:steroid delta-isomerase-like uncharacterized protein